MKYIGKYLSEEKLLTRECTYIVGKYKKLFVRALETDRRAFLAVLQRVQINFIFNDNVCILCLSCNIKKSKTTAKFSDNS